LVRANTRSDRTLRSHFGRVLRQRTGPR
jgi:hypothetical protein